VEKLSQSKNTRIFLQRLSETAMNLWILGASATSRPSSFRALLLQIRAEYVSEQEFSKWMDTVCERAETHSKS
jgi:hypothetical protein